MSGVDIEDSDMKIALRIAAVLTFLAACGYYLINGVWRG